MRLRLLPGLCLALVLLGLAWSSGGIDPLSVPSGDEATYVLAAQSLWHDRDLSWDRQDLARAGRLWGQGPAGLTLLTNDGGKTMGYGRPLVYPAAALPFYALFGARGFAVLNMLLFLGMAAAGFHALRDETGAAALFAAGFFFASAFFAGVFRAGPEVFTGACLFFALFLWRRGESPRALAAAGLLFAAATFAAPWTALLALPVLTDLVLRRRVRPALTLFISALLAFGVFALVEWRLTGDWTAQGGVQRRTFESEFPLETTTDLWQGYRGAEPASDLATGLRLLPRNALYLLAGRHTGLLPYFPFALLALGLAFTKPGDRARHLLLAALALYGVAILLVHPHEFHGGPGALGSRYLAAVYPAFFFLPGRIAVRRLLVLPYAAAGLWTAAAILAVLPPALPAPPGTAAFRALPLELTLLPGGHLSGYAAQTWGDAVWIVPADAFFVEEKHPHGVWVEGATRSEVVVVSPVPLDRLRFTVYSLSAENELTLASGTDRLLVRFDTEGKRAGTPVDLAVQPVARDLGFFPGVTGDFFYRFTLETTGGAVPARIEARSRDPRYLGVFLDFTGEGP
jgi:hypothetical protein